VTRHMDTYWCVIGAEPLIWSWWEVVEYFIPSDDPWGDNSRKWVGWAIDVALDPDYDPDGQAYRLDHQTIMRGLQAIVSDAHSYRPVVVDNARMLLSGDRDSVDSVDFDADTADVVLQVALFGEIRYC
jgi:hypothetical protein